MGYSQDDWVRLHGYSRMPWNTIVELWFQYNSLLTRLMENIPEDRLETPCFIGQEPAVTLQFLIEDYTFCTCNISSTCFSAARPSRNILV
ncbi:MAG TPA: hypothetical protein VHZ55_06920 [Bryobacteraceae bacterium]|nr:hypothetical protein [Bryobacteraceae bacterium]